MMGRLGLMGVALVVCFTWIGPEALFAEERYTVKMGDSLYTISKSYGISVEALKKANGLEGDHLKPRQMLIIPNPKKKPAFQTAHKRYTPETKYHIVQQGESLYGISKKTGLSVDEIKRVNHLQTDQLQAGQRLLLRKQLEDRVEEDEETGGVEEIQESELGQGESLVLSEPLARWRDPAERDLFVRVVKNFLGVPYKLGGATLRGIDCSAFVKKVFEIFNVQLPRTAREQLRIGKKVGRAELEEGDLIFFKTHRANNTHVGIYIGNNEFVHASYRSKEVRIDSLDAPYFQQRFIKGVRLIELERES